MSTKILLKDANGKLYAIPQEVAEAHALSNDDAHDLVHADSKSAQTERLASLGVLTQIDGAHLPNFKLLMQTEYPMRRVNRP